MEGKNRNGVADSSNQIKTFPAPSSPKGFTLRLSHLCDVTFLFLTGWHYMLFIIDLTCQYSRKFLWIFSDIEQWLGAEDPTSLWVMTEFRNPSTLATWAILLTREEVGKECVKPARAETTTTLRIKSHGEANITSADEESSDKMNFWRVLLFSNKELYISSAFMRQFSIDLLITACFSSNSFVWMWPTDEPHSWHCSVKDLTSCTTL